MGATTEVIAGDTYRDYYSTSIPSLPNEHAEDERILCGTVRIVYLTS